MQRNQWRDYFLGIATGNPVSPSGTVTDDEKDNSPGLTIFNTDTECYEFWNGRRWISLCEGNSLMSLSPDPCRNVAADGTGCGQEFTITDPDCMNGPFTIIIVTGESYADLKDVNEADGTFQVSFRENNSVAQRSVVVRVTSGCTGLYKDFLFLQEGHACPGDLGSAPAIKTIPTAVDDTVRFCTDGAVYLSIDETQLTGNATLSDVIWTRNDIEFARGVNNIVAIRDGKYAVWLGIIGCGGATPVILARNIATTALQPVSIVVTGNNGMVCGVDQEATLIAMNPNSNPAGTVLWYKDGVLQDGTGGTDNITGSTVNAGIGSWFAVVREGGCFSRPSETVTVILNPNATTPLTVPVIESGGNYCAGSIVRLTVSDATYMASYTYTWYENNTQIGMGRSVMYTVSPAEDSHVVIRCRASLSGSCAQEALVDQVISSDPIPNRPYIDGNPQLCNGMATLNVRPDGAGAFTYAWYKDDALIGTSQQITVTSGGDYYATVTDGCTSPMAQINIPNNSSAPPVLTMVSSSATPDAVSQRDIITYSTTITFGPATQYIWTLTNDSLVSGGGINDPFAVVKFNQAGAASVKVEAQNVCGSASAIQNVAVSVFCSKPEPSTIYPSGETLVSRLQNESFTLGPVSVSFKEGSPATAYQWYRNTAKSTAGGTLLTGMTGNSLVTSEAAAGTYYYYCQMKNAGCTNGEEDDKVYTGIYVVTVTVDPATLPAGTGYFTGKTVFDIAAGNNGNDHCGALSDRQTFQKTDFSLTSEQDPVLGSTPTYTGHQVYTFTPRTAVSNVRFFYKDGSGQAIESMTPKGNYSGAIAANTSCKALVVYKPGLNTALIGKKRTEAVKPELYVVYNDAGIDKAIKMTVSLQDCSSCGAKTKAGGWLSFMCHNLGADETLDPFTYSNTGGSTEQGIVGSMYQWGRQTDGHEKRNSTLTTTQATNASATLPAAVIGKRVNNQTDWYTGNSTNLWGDGTANENVKKAENDPCPHGWKIPSKVQLRSLWNTASGNAAQTTPNVWTYSNGLMSATLYLPKTGIVNIGVAINSFNSFPGYVVYWGTPYQENDYFGLLDSNFYTGDSLNDNYRRASGMAVRCIEDK
ncbi:MAG: fibrobacter succinogenes major paralogous domain-containing protein [Prevotella sp.]|nr:fibrobacter succinogenes major paralogous domain-containing protein [Prevotella sp.]